jgi:hypothetical protein
MADRFHVMQVAQSNGRARTARLKDRESPHTDLKIIGYSLMSIPVFTERAIVDGRGIAIRSTTVISDRRDCSGDPGELTWGESREAVRPLSRGQLTSRPGTSTSMTGKETEP